MIVQEKSSIQIRSPNISLFIVVVSCPFVLFPKECHVTAGFGPTAYTIIVKITFFT
ncbi:hypothetical protein BY996DRAFT_7069508, partial [Phakopsora pachyrhizi]